MKSDYKVSVPEGKCGKWEIQKFTVSEQDAKWENLQMIFSGEGYRRIEPGTYTRLIYGDTVVMSDTQAEVNDHIGFISRANGRILIAGLGLGMALQAVASKPTTAHVTIIEKSSEVLQLVSKHYQDMFGSKVSFINADIFDWKPSADSRWDYIWFDIWNTLCTDNLKEMGKLHRRFTRYTNWYGSWGSEFLKYQRRKDRNSLW